MEIAADRSLQYVKREYVATEYVATEVPFSELSTTIDNNLLTNATPALLPQLQQSSRSGWATNLDMWIAEGNSTSVVSVKGVRTPITEQGALIEAQAFFADDPAFLQARLLKQRIRLRLMFAFTATVVAQLYIPQISVGPNLVHWAWPRETEHPTTPQDSVRAGRDLHPGLRAVDDLRQWLTLSISDVANISGISESAIYWWAEHPTSIPRAAKIQPLLALRALVWTFVEQLSEAEARNWFRSGDPSPLDRLKEDPKALEAVEKEGYRLLLKRADANLAGTTSDASSELDQEQQQLERLAAEEREFEDPLVAEEFDPSSEPDNDN
jgi:hypothetical protein